jgi:hypothetical protein
MREEKKEKKADVGTKALPQHRLFALMNESGMVYVNTFEDVCIEEHQRQVEKSHNSQQLQKAAKLIMRLCVAMGLEPTGTAAQQCTTPGVVCRDQVAYGTSFMVVLLACAMVGLAMYGWKKLKKAMRDADHSGAIGRSLCDYAAWLCERLDNLSYGETNEERLNQTSVRLTVLEADIRDGVQVLDETTDQLRYGLMELGGFMRDQALTAAERSHMFIQERGNFVLWQMPQRNPDTTEEVQHEHHEGGESEIATDDEEPGTSTPATGLTRFLFSFERGAKCSAGTGGI